MPKQIIKVPPSKTEQTIEIELPDTLKHTVTGTTPLDTIPPVEPPPNPNPPPVPPAGYALSYENDFDDLTDINANQLGRGKIVTLGNRKVFRAEVKVGDPSISSGFRSEQQYNSAAQNPKEGAVEYDVLYESFETTAWGGSSIQWHPNNSGSALLFLETAQGTFNTYQYIQKYKNTTTKIVPNKWYRMRWEMKWSTGNDGYARLFIDGVKFWEYTGRTQDNDGQPYFKLGLNFFSGERDQTKSYRGGVVYYDNLRVYKKG